MIDWTTTPRVTFKLKSGTTPPTDGSTPTQIEIVGQNNNDFCAVDASGVVTFVKGGTYIGSMTMNRDGSSPGSNSLISCRFRNATGNAIHILAARALLAGQTALTGGAGVFTVSDGDKASVILDSGSLSGINALRLEIARLM